MDAEAKNQSEQPSSLSNLSKIVRLNIVDEVMVAEHKKRVDNINVQIMSNNQICDLKNKIFDIV